MAHTHSHSGQDTNRKRLMAAFAVTAIFMVAEVIGGWISGSLALLADAGHMLTDAAALLMALLAVQLLNANPATVILLVCCGSPHWQPLLTPLP